MLLIQNQQLRVEVSALGAELSRITHRETGLDYLWCGDPTFWGRKAPILFPIVGKLKDNKMIYDGVEYRMNQHGFARDLTFEVVEQTQTLVSLICQSTSETKKLFPFDWTLVISYEVVSNQLMVRSEVHNISAEKDMLFSIGYHPAFRVPIDDDSVWADYELQFNGNDEAMKWLIKDGLIDTKTTQGFSGGKVKLSEETFENDALVFKHLKSNTLRLSSNTSAYGLTFFFEGFPYLGIWSKPNAPFVCIEPWHGIADSVDHNGDFEQKDGIILLKPDERFHCGYSVDFY
ncbi:MAG: aldose 1-epimerase family protein [Saprospiraceae bacterium]